MSVTDSDEVLVARMASGETMASSSRKICFLTSIDSTTASTTKSASVRALSSVLKLIRPSTSACSASVIFWRDTARAVECSRCCRPRAVASSFWFDADDRVALASEHLRDPRTHGAETHDPDGLEGASGGLFSGDVGHGPQAS